MLLTMSHTLSADALQPAPPAPPLPIAPVAVGNARAVVQPDVYIPKKNYEHQEDVYKHTKDREWFGYFSEQGTGKSKMAIDSVGYLYKTDKINFVLLFSINGVHRAWKDIEIPKFLNIDKKDYRTVLWPKNYNSLKSFKKSQFEHKISSIFKRKLLCVLIINIESMSRLSGYENIISCLDNSYIIPKKSMLIIDESSRIKNIKAKRTDFMFKLVKKFKYKRLISGTPMSESPDNIFAQFQMMSPDIFSNIFWGEPGIFITLQDFKRRYLKYKQDVVKQADGSIKVYTRPDGIIKFREKEFQEMMSNNSYTIKLDDCKDMPEKIYKKVFIDMTEKQAKIYDNIVKNSDLMMTDEICVSCGGTGKVQEIIDMNIDINSPEANHAETEELNCPDCVGGVPVMSIPHVLARLHKLQQITSGYVFYDDKKLLINKPEDNPKLSYLIDLVKDGKPTLIWVSGVFEASLIAKYLPDCGLYAGKVDPDELQDILLHYNDEDYKYKHLVITIQKGSYGLNLQKASRAVFFSCTWSLEQRLQAEARNRRINSEHKTVIIDLMCDKTIDSEIHTTLDDKKELMERLMSNKAYWMHQEVEEES